MTIITETCRANKNDDYYRNMPCTLTNDDYYRNLPCTLTNDDYYRNMPCTLTNGDYYRNMRAHYLMTIITETCRAN